jgi:N-terminal domain of anti-restriction factor ArdC
VVGVRGEGLFLPLWLTFKQALELGGNVRKGEHGELVVYTNRITRTETDEKGAEIEREIPFLKGYTVFSLPRPRSARGHLLVPDRHTGPAAGGRFALHAGRAIAAIPSSASPRPAPSMAWRIWAAGSTFPASVSFRSCRTLSAAAVGPPETGARPQFCRHYVIRWTKWTTEAAPASADTVGLPRPRSARGHLLVPLMCVLAACILFLPELRSLMFRDLSRA